MIKEKTMYTLLCDNCGKDSCEGTDYSCWSDTEQAIQSAIDSDWIEVEEIEMIYEVWNPGRLLGWHSATMSEYEDTHEKHRRTGDKQICKHYCPECVNYDDEGDLVLKKIGNNEIVNECYFTPCKKTTSQTICDNCGQEKMLHTIVKIPDSLYEQKCRYYE